MNFLKKQTKKLLVKLEVISEVFVFLWEHKLWWLIPIIFIILILMMIFVFGQYTGIAPFIYTLF